VESGSDFDNSDYGDGELYGIVEWRCDEELQVNGRWF
jgi:hypothetical protein